MQFIKPPSKFLRSGGSADRGRNTAHIEKRPALRLLRQRHRNCNGIGAAATYEMSLYGRYGFLRPIADMPQRRHFTTP